MLVYFALLISVYCCGVEYNYERCTFSASRLENTKILWRDLMVVFEDIGLDVWADAGTAMQAARNDPGMIHAPV